jgi:hypothetical protein
MKASPLPGFVPGFFCDGFASGVVLPINAAGQ